MESHCMLSLKAKCLCFSIVLSAVLSVCVCAVCASGDPVLTVWSLWTLHVYVRTYVCTPVDTICTVHSVYTEVVTCTYVRTYIPTYVCLYVLYVHVCVFLAGIHLLIVVGIFGMATAQSNTHTNLGKSTRPLGLSGALVLLSLGSDLLPSSPKRM